MRAYWLVILALPVFATACGGGSARPLADSPLAYMVPSCPSGFRETRAEYHNPMTHPAKYPDTFRQSWGKGAPIRAITSRQCEDGKFRREVTIWTFESTEAAREAVEWRKGDLPNTWLSGRRWKPPAWVGFLRFDSRSSIEDCWDQDSIRENGCAWQSGIELQMAEIVVEINSIDSDAGYSSALGEVVGNPRWQDAETLADEIIRRHQLGPAGGP